MRSHSFLAPVTTLSRRVKILLLTFLLLSIVCLLVVSPRLATQLSSETRAISVLARTIEIANAPFGAIGNFFARIATLRGIEEKYRLLQVEYESLLFLRSYAERLEQENRALRETVQYRVDSSENFAVRQVARVLARARGSFAHNVIVNIGTAQEITAGSIALSKGALVGIVTSAGENGARVRLLRDPQSRVAIKIIGGKQRALLAGRGAKRPFLLFAQGRENIKTRARVVTSGDAGVLPPNIPIGRIISSSDEIIEVALNVDTDALENVDLVVYKPHSGNINQ